MRYFFYSSAKVSLCYFLWFGPLFAASNKYSSLPLEEEPNICCASHLGRLSMCEEMFCSCGCIYKCRDVYNCAPEFWCLGCISISFGLTVAAIPATVLGGLKYLWLAAKPIAEITTACGYCFCCKGPKSIRYCAKYLDKQQFVKDFEAGEEAGPYCRYIPECFDALPESINHCCQYSFEGCQELTTVCCGPSGKPTREEMTQ